MKNKNITVNKICYDFSKELSEVINKYGQQLPSYVIYLIVEKIYNDVKDKHNNILLNELMQEGEKEETVTVPIITEEEEEKKE